MAEPTLDAMRAATEHARLACHSAFDAPSDPGSLYARTGALYDLLTKVECLTEHLRRAAAELAAHPPAGLFSDDAEPPAFHAGDAASSLLYATAAIQTAHRAVNDAWSVLSHLGADDPDGGEGR